MQLGACINQSINRRSGQPQASPTLIDFSLRAFFQEITFDHGEVRSICTFDRESYNEGVYQVQRLAKVFFLGCVTRPLRPEVSDTI